MRTSKIGFPKERIAEFCRKWRIVEFSLFGSILRDDFNPDSDIDVLVVFEDNTTWTLFDHIKMEQELSKIVGRRANVVSRSALEQSANFIRRNTILQTAERFYAAR